MQERDELFVKSGKVPEFAMKKFPQAPFVPVLWWCCGEWCNLHKMRYCPGCRRDLPLPDDAVRIRKWRDYRRKR